MCVCLIVFFFLGFWIVLLDSGGILPQGKKLQTLKQKVSRIGHSISLLFLERHGQKSRSLPVRKSKAQELEVLIFCFFKDISVRARAPRWNTLSPAKEFSQRRVLHVPSYLGAKVYPSYIFRGVPQRIDQSDSWRWNIENLYNVGILQPSTSWHGKNRFN